MATDFTHDRVKSPEELRETIFAQRRNIDILKRELADSTAVIKALDRLLVSDDSQDPFNAALTTLKEIFNCTHALALIESNGPGSPLHCIFADVPDLVGTQWEAVPILEKVLAGEPTATIAEQMLDAWPEAAIHASISPRQAALYLPISLRERRGMMMLLRNEGEVGFNRRQVRLGRKFSILVSHAFAQHAANRSENERRRLASLTDELRDAQAKIAHRANHDELTGLPNRAFLTDYMASALGRDKQQLALAFIDIDGFKQVNDVYGHEVGDRLLVTVADRLRNQIRGTDTLARLSGDEFILLIDPVRDEVTLNRIVSRLLDDLKEPFELDGHQILASASIGIAIYPDHGLTYDELRRNADVAMYRAKMTNPGTVVYYDVEMGHAASLRSEQEQILRSAVRERSFCCALQPKVNIRNMSVVGFEALARRVHHDGTLHTPGKFIPIATKIGLLDEISHLIIADVIAWLPEIDARYGDHTSVSINVSAKQASNPATMRALLCRLAETGQPDRFIVELTEDAIIDTETFGHQIAPLFREFAIMASIDDFGTGHSALTTLLEISAQELKIDRAFIKHVSKRTRSQIILQAIAAVSHRFGINLVAEGVETQTELAYLLANTPIMTVQGYLFSRPLPARELLDAHDAITDRLDEFRSDPPHQIPTTS